MKCQKCKRTNLTIKDFYLRYDCDIPKQKQKECKVCVKKTAKEKRDQKMLGNILFL